LFVSSLKIKSKESKSLIFALNFLIFTVSLSGDA
jgi:hypothetical protein